MITMSLPRYRIDVTFSVFSCSAFSGSPDSSYHFCIAYDVINSRVAV